MRSGSVAWGIVGNTGVQCQHLQFSMEHEGKGRKEQEGKEGKGVERGSERMMAQRVVCPNGT